MVSWSSEGLEKRARAVSPDVDLDESCHVFAASSISIGGTLAACSGSVFGDGRDTSSGVDVAVAFLENKPMLRI